MPFLVVLVVVVLCSNRIIARSEAIAMAASAAGFSSTSFGLTQKVWISLSYIRNSLLFVLCRIKLKLVLWILKMIPDQTVLGLTRILQIPAYALFVSRITNQETS